MPCPLAELVQRGEYRRHGSRCALLWEARQPSTEKHRQNVFPTSWKYPHKSSVSNTLSKYIRFSSLLSAACNVLPVKRQLESLHFQAQG